MDCVSSVCICLSVFGYIQTLEQTTAKKLNIDVIVRCNESLIEQTRVQKVSAWSRSNDPNVDIIA